MEHCHSWIMSKYSVEIASLVGHLFIHYCVIIILKAVRKSIDYKTFMK